MEKTFANLLRHSKLATYDRRLNQVYHSPKSSKQRGDWGVKRNLPTVIRTPYVTIGQLDTVEHQTPWDSGHSQVAFLRRWKENFGDISTAPNRTRTRFTQPGDDRHNLASMTRAQFNNYIKHTITPETVSAFQEALRMNEITQDQVYDYLNITFKPERSTVKGPFYSHAPLQQPATNITDEHNDYMVEGRILNAQKGGYAVGIGGIVALLPKRFAIGVKKSGDRFMIRKFYVRRAYIDDQGIPQVIVSLHPSLRPKAIDSHPEISSPTSALPSSTDDMKTSRTPWTSMDNIFATTPPNNLDDLQLFLLGQDNMGRSKRQQMMTTQTSTPSDLPLLDAHHKSKEEMLEDHSVLMNRIIALLKKGTPKKD